MPDNTTTAAPIGKLKRSHLLHYIDASFGGSNPSWFLIGKDIEDMSINLNAETETKKNIWDETVANDKGYLPDAEVNTYYANTDDSIYEKIKDIAMNRLTGDDCKTKILEVWVDKTEAPFDAWTEDIIVKPQSYGGPQGGVNIPYKISFDGNRKTGTVTIANKVPTFTETT